MLSARHLLPGEGSPPRGELAFWPGSGSLRLSLARPLGPRPPRSTLTTTRWTLPWATLSSHSSTTSSGTRNIFGCCSGEGGAGACGSWEGHRLEVCEPASVYLLPSWRPREGQRFS